jgi:hypothetical protein
MRYGRVITVAVTACTLALVVGVGFGVQAAGLGRVSQKPLLVSRVLAKLLPYTVSRMRMTVDGTQLSGMCTERWEGRRRFQMVDLSNGSTLVEVANKLVQKSKVAQGEFDLAGCPRPLRKWLTEQLNDGQAIDITKTHFDRHDVLEIRFPHAKLGLDLFVSRVGLFPLALVLHGNRVSGASVMTYGVSAPLPAPLVTAG